MNLLDELIAQQELAKAGSVMARPQQPEWRRSLPQTMGPTAGTVAQTGLDLLDALIAFGGPQPTDAGSLAGIFRTIGLKRAGGDLNPSQYLEALLAQPRYDRYKQLVQGMVRRGLGDEFPVYRGKEQVDPLMRALVQGSDQLPGSTAVSLDPNIAEYFARVGAETTRKPAYVMKGRATPESVQALVPRRNTHGHEMELVVDPTLMPKRELAAKAQDMGYGAVEFTRPRPAFSEEPVQQIEDIMQVLTEGEQIKRMQPLTPGLEGSQGIPKYTHEEVNMLLKALGYGK